MKWSLQVWDLFSYKILDVIYIYIIPLHQIPSLQINKLISHSIWNGKQGTLPKKHYSLLHASCHFLYDIFLILKLPLF